MAVTEAWLWVYVAAMAAGALLFIVWSRDRQQVPRAEYLVAMAIPLWSGLWYAVMALGGGQTEIAGETTYWARYVDWVVTTPLLLIALAFTGTQALARKPWRIVGLLIGADVVMILSGLLADLSTAQWLRYGLYALGVVALIVVYSLIWGPLRAAAERQPAPMARTYREVAALLSILWLGYPLIWILGPSGLGLFGDVTDTALFVLLPILSKVGWSIVDLSRLRSLGRRGELTVA
ncbi:bacteriorhodopsin [Micromonospora phaseoli]|uniref:Bacteriorhodopsin n=1 Tax=Micromonospora phaseoli TaxID=1144548 RepID=A0A1H6XB79_9ACTN|nr:bacteriorhodopsin [Micromonospora phaseoli]PZW01999.1 bacteriorhodopsin [Micromonospora phaseoli]GIJ80161.1 rhodopsin [Micromonospora phaseoli]SEJ21785.1 bacteriorhodopsin [Micromonospora phaseoli]